MEMARAAGWMLLTAFLACFCLYAFGDAVTRLDTAFLLATQLTAAPRP